MKAWATACTAAWAAAMAAGAPAMAQEAAPAAPAAASAAAAPLALTFALPNTGLWCAPSEYPAPALRAEAQGMTTLRFTIGQDGVLSGIQLLKSAGDTRAHKMLDRAAAQMLRTCRPQGDAPVRAGTFSHDFAWIIR